MAPNTDNAGHLPSLGRKKKSYMAFALTMRGVTDYLSAVRETRSVANSIMSHYVCCSSPNIRFPY